MLLCEKDQDYWNKKYFFYDALLSMVTNISISIFIGVRVLGPPNMAHLSKI